MKKQFSFVLLLSAVLLLLCIPLTGCKTEPEIIIPTEAPASEPAVVELDEIATSAPTEEPTLPPTPTPTPTPEPTPELITNERLDSGEFDSFYDDAVFVGDSLTLVFSHRVRNVRNETQTAYLGKAQFIAATSMSAKRASENRVDGNVCFRYRGRKITLPDGIAMCEAKKVFMMFGLNDLRIRNWDDVIGYFSKIIDNILEKNPDVEIIVQGVLPVRKSFYKKEDPKWNSFNERLEQLCAEKNVAFISFAEELMDEEGYLRKDLAEGDAHLNIAGEDVWVRFLRRYAAERMLKNVVFETP